MVQILIVACVVALSACSQSDRTGESAGGSATPVVGAWLGELQTQNGWLPFNMQILRDGEAWSAAIINGEERIEVSDVRMDGGEFVIGFPHYDSQIRASVGEDGRSLEGSWTKVRGEDNVAEVVFRARAGDHARFQPDGLALEHGESSGTPGDRWRLTFEDSDDDAVGIFRVIPGEDGSNLRATVLTTTGDYRFLSGVMDRSGVRLSCFDGAHAFLFRAEFREDGSLTGTFDSGDWYSVSWTGVRDESVALADMFAETTWEDDADLSEVVFRDLDGNPVRLTDAEFVGKPTLIKVTGTWCPNCNDAAPFFADIHRRYRDRGLQVVALAFELTEDFERSVTQVRRFKERHGIEFPVLIAGLSDKDRASEFLPVLDRVRSYPTTIFMNADGSVRAIHTGFTGPATGEAYVQMKAEFERLIGEMLE